MTHLHRGSSAATAWGWDGCAPSGGRSLAGCQHRFAECAALRLRRRSPQMVFPVCHRLNLFVRRVVAFSDCQDLLLPVCLSAPSLFRVSSDPVLRYSYRSLFSTCAVFSHIYPNLIYPEHQILSCERAKDCGFGADTLCRAVGLCRLSEVISSHKAHKLVSCVVFFVCRLTSALEVKVGVAAFMG